MSSDLRNDIDELDFQVAHFSRCGVRSLTVTYWLMAWLLHQSHCGTLPHIGSCQWCQGWAWSPFRAVPRSLSGWSGRRKWLGWWLDPSVQNALNGRRRRDSGTFKTTLSTRVLQPKRRASDALTRSTNPMQVRFSQLWKVEIDHNIHSLNINSSCEKVCGKTWRHLLPQTAKGQESLHMHKICCIRKSRTNKTSYNTI